MRGVRKEEGRWERQAGKGKVDVTESGVSDKQKKGRRRAAEIIELEVRGWGDKSSPERMKEKSERNESSGGNRGSGKTSTEEAGGGSGRYQEGNKKTPNKTRKAQKRNAQKIEATTTLKHDMNTERTEGSSAGAKTKQKTAKGSGREQRSAANGVGRKA